MTWAYAGLFFNLLTLPYFVYYVSPHENILRENISCHHLLIFVSFPITEVQYSTFTLQLGEHEFGLQFQEIKSMVSSFQRNVLACGHSRAKMLRSWWLESKAEEQCHSGRAGTMNSTPNYTSMASTCPLKSMCYKVALKPVKLEQLNLLYLCNWDPAQSVQYVVYTQ